MVHLFTGIYVRKLSKEYNFSIRQTLLDEARDLKYVVNNYHNRAYNNPELLIFHLQNSLHKLAAKIQLEGGARIEGVALIKSEQLLGFKLDSITNIKKGIIFTKEKGGKVGEVLVSLETYNELQNYLSNNPKLLIYNLKNPINQLAAKIQLEGGARIEGVALIKPEQLLGIKIDKVTQVEKGIIYTKEKGGKQGEVLVSLKTYAELENYLSLNSKFKINRQDYYNDIKQAAIISKEVSEGSHGLRWNFAKRRMFECGKADYSYYDSLQEVSYEMKHNRASITEHYLGG